MKTIFTLALKMSLSHNLASIGKFSPVSIHKNNFAVNVFGYQLSEYSVIVYISHIP